MNLIEQLGGYEKAKSKFRDNGSLHAERMKAALLQYRREHGIYEIGDSFVFIGGDIDEVMTVQFVWDDAVWGGYCGEIPKKTEIRHATPEEIAAGHRL